MRNISSINLYITLLQSINRLLDIPPLTYEDVEEFKKLFLNEKFNNPDVPYFDDIKNLVSLLRNKYDNDSTYKNFIQVLLIVADKMQQTDAYSYLLFMYNKIDKSLKEKLELNTKDDIDPKKIIDISKPNDLFSYIDLIPNNQDKILFLLYIYHPRRLEYRFLKYTYETDYSKLTDYNYFVVPNKELLFNKYKTEKKYNQQIIKIDDMIYDRLLDYIKDVKPDDFLFTYNGEMYKQASFSKKIGYIFKKIYGEHITPRYLRISKANELNDLPITKELKERAYKLGHSLNTHLNYRRI